MHRTNHLNYSSSYHRLSQSQRRLQQNLVDQWHSSWLTSIIGCIVFSLGMWLQFWNEGKAVQMTRSLEEAKGLILSLKSPAAAYNENNGRLVHLTGQLEIGEPLTEPEYGVSLPAVKLKRRVQMYQWVEYQHESHKPQDIQHPEVSFSYSMEWKDKLIDSSQFYIQNGHYNPKEIPLTSLIYIIDHVKVGGFILGSTLKNMFNDFILITGDERPERRDIKLHSGLYYHSQDVWNPDIGDIRIQFSYAGKSGDLVSIIAMQSAKELVPYVSASGETILMLRQGEFTVEEMFLHELAQNWFFTWTLRGAAWLLMFLGANCITHLLNIGFVRYTFLYNILVVGNGSLDFAVSSSMSLLIISLAWIWYKPMFGGVLAFISSIPFVYSAIKNYLSPTIDNYQE